MISSPFSKRSFLLLASALMLILPSCKSSEDVHQESVKDLPPAEVSVASAAEIRPLRQTQVMASVEAAQSASIAARVSGNIVELTVQLGSQVKKGDTLIVISADEVRAKLNQARAQLDQARRNLKREQNLLKKKAATPESVKTLEEQTKIAEAAFKEVQTMLGYTTIKAPFDGTITAKPASIGDLATPGRTLLRLEGGSSLQVIADIPEALVLDLAIGDQLPVEIEAAGVEVDGTIIEIAPTADPTSRTAPVKLQIPISEKVRSGQFARVSLPGSTGTAIMIPISAIRPFGQLERVFIAKDDTLRLQLIKTGRQIDDQVEVLSGITADDLVVISQNPDLSDGRKVIIK